MVGLCGGRGVAGFEPSPLALYPHGLQKAGDRHLVYNIGGTLWVFVRGSANAMEAEGALRGGHWTYTKTSGLWKLLGKEECGGHKTKSKVKGAGIAPLMPQAVQDILSSSWQLKQGPGPSPTLLFVHGDLTFGLFELSQAAPDN
eukprot:123115-Pelagomonas_calceolata.AAC.4